MTDYRYDDLPDFNKKNDFIYDVEYYTDDSASSKNSTLRDYTPKKQAESPLKSSHFESFAELLTDTTD